MAFLYIDKLSLAVSVSPQWASGREKRETERENVAWKVKDRCRTQLCDSCWIPQQFGLPGEGIGLPHRGVHSNWVWST